MQNSVVVFTFAVLDQKYPLQANLIQEMKIVSLSFKLGTYNPGHNILGLCNILVQIRFTTSKTKLDI